jgi:hypothetical protein
MFSFSIYDRYRVVQCDLDLLSINALFIYPVAHNVLEHTWEGNGGVISATAAQL